MKINTTLILSIFIIILFSLAALCCICFADSSLFYKEINLIGGYSDTNHWVDIYSMMASSLGFEYYRKFSNDYGDYLTADLQMRASYDSIAESSEAWGIEVHNAWFEYKLMPSLKVKAGHFDCPFGLEPVLDTHATLLQTLAERDIGFKQDWGAEIKGFMGDFDYEVALQLGSGMSIRRQDGSFLTSTRIGSPAGRNLQYGFSLLYGNVLETEGMGTFPRNTLLSPDAVTKKRIGLDAQYLYGPMLFKGEIAYGRNDSEDVLGYLAEIDFTLPEHQNWEFELQFESWINDLDISSSDDSTLTLGTTYKLSQTVTLRAAFSHDFHMTDKEEENIFAVQFYFLG